MSFSILENIKRGIYTTELYPSEAVGSPKGSKVSRHTPNTVKNTFKSFRIITPKGIAAPTPRLLTFVKFPTSHLDKRILLLQPNSFSSEKRTSLCKYTFFYIILSLSITIYHKYLFFFYFPKYKIGVKIYLSLPFSRLRQTMQNSNSLIPSDIIKTTLNQISSKI